MVGRTLREQDKVDLKNSQGKKNEDYELLLQKAEGDIKRYIRVIFFSFLKFENKKFFFDRMKFSSNMLSVQCKRKSKNMIKTRIIFS